MMTTTKIELALAFQLTGTLIGTPHKYVVKYRVVTSIAPKIGLPDLFNLELASGVTVVSIEMSVMDMATRRVPFTFILHVLLLLQIILMMFPRMFVTSLVSSTSTSTIRSFAADHNRNWSTRMKHEHSFRSMAATSYHSVHKQQQQQKKKKIRKNTKISFAKLEDPQVIFANNHVLVVNKPPGWHSVPNESFSNTSKNMMNHPNNNNKCLLQYLKRKSLGGGSQSDFLLPMHRLDQPCSGCLLYAKTSKAATRITTAWKQGKVIKEYWCIVQGDLKSMIQRSTPNDSFTSSPFPYTISGLWTTVASHKPSTSSRSVQIQHISMSSADGSVDTNTTNFPPNTRLCQIQWGPLQTINTSSKRPTLEVIRVQTNTGAKHQIRAMLSYLLQSPIVGDYRYGYNQQSIGKVSRSTTAGVSHGSAPMLPDQSVALHARALLIPTSLGNTTLPIFVAPIPATWVNTFGLLLEDDRIKNDTISL
jgi:23S rRNA-/tRNA-specific pseudouridylate synthase